MQFFILLLKEYFILLWIHLKVKVKNFVEYMGVVTCYYRSLQFAKIDIALLSSYFFMNPFRISKHFFIRERRKEHSSLWRNTPLNFRCYCSQL